MPFPCVVKGAVSPAVTAIGVFYSCRRNLWWLPARIRIDVRAHLIRRYLPISSVVKRDYMLRRDLLAIVPMRDSPRSNTQFLGK